MIQSLEKLLIPIGVTAVGATCLDFYTRNYYWGWDKEKQIADRGEASIKTYLVDYSKISKPAAVTCTRPNLSWQAHSFFIPRNGAVVKARDCGEEHPNWVQLAAGDYVEKLVCGQQVLVEIAESELPRPMTRNCQYFPELLPNDLNPSWSEASEKSKKLGEDTKFMKEKK